jgi:DNA-directed RNA polymerase specialized sigma24 family protein
MNWLAYLLKALGRGCGALSPSCKEAVRLQSDMLERKPSFLQWLGLRLHLVICRWCRRYGEQIRFLHDAAHEHPEEMAGPATAKLSDEARERIKRNLRAGEK